MEQEELNKELIGVGNEPVPDLDLPAAPDRAPGTFHHFTLLSITFLSSGIWKSVNSSPEQKEGRR